MAALISHLPYPDTDTDTDTRANNAFQSSTLTTKPPAKGPPATMPITKWFQPARLSDEETDQQFMVRIDPKYSQYYDELQESMTRLELVGMLRSRAWNVLRDYEKENVNRLWAEMKEEARKANERKVRREKIVLEGPFWKR